MVNNFDAATIAQDIRTKLLKQVEKKIIMKEISKLQQQHEQFIEQFDTDLVTCTESAPSFLIFDSQKDQF
jgi:hypothetical protein